MEVREPSAKYLRPGYKQTEVGVIPADWDIHSLGEIGKFKNGLNKDSAAFGHGSPFVNLMDVFGVNSISTAETLGLVACSSVERSSYDLRLGDVIFVRSSVKPSGVGLTAVIEADLPDTVFSGFLIRFRDSGFIDAGFKKHCFHGGRFRNSLIASSSVSANTNISQNNLAKLAIPLPPTKAEQEAIAEALSDADALIESLEQLLAKKRHVKQGAMQDLLTSKKRLPGFSRVWEVNPLCGIATATKGSQLGESAWNEHGAFAHLNGGTSPSAYTDKWNSSGDTIAISEGGNSCGYVQFMPEPFWAGGHCYSVRPTKIDNRFLYHALKGQEQSIMALRVGSGLPNVQKTALLAFELHYPKCGDEQTAIATILSDMDAELTALEAKLTKARQIKQAMMQALLTGRIRLV